MVGDREVEAAFCMITLKRSRPAVGLIFLRNSNEVLFHCTSNISSDIMNIIQSHFTIIHHGLFFHGVISLSSIMSSSKI
jgi:hypothetical protein